MTALSLRAIRLLLTNAPPMAVFYQRQAHINSDAQAQRRRARARSTGEQA